MVVLHGHWTYINEPRRVPALHLFGVDGDSSSRLSPDDLRAALPFLPNGVTAISAALGRHEEDHLLAPCSPGNVRPLFEWLLGLSDSRENELYDTPGGPIRLDESISFSRGMLLLALRLAAAGRFAPGIRQGAAVWLSVAPEKTAGFTELAHVVDRQPHLLPEGVALVSILDGLVDAFLREGLDDTLRQRVYSILHPNHFVPVTPTDHWLHGLLERTASESGAGALEWLESDCSEWIEQIHAAATRPVFRTVLLLVPPLRQEGLWKLSYAMEDSRAEGRLVNALEVWMSAEQEDGVRQEALLRDLRLASDHVPEIVKSLNEAFPAETAIRQERAYELLTDQLEPLLSLGLSVRVPTWWKRPPKLGLKLGLQQADAKNTYNDTAPRTRGRSRLGFESLIQFHWQLTLGGATVDRAQAEAWLRSASPLVSHEGIWFELTPQKKRSLKRLLDAAPSGTATWADAVQAILRLKEGEFGGDGIDPDSEDPIFAALPFTKLDRNKEDWTRTFDHIEVEAAPQLDEFARKLREPLIVNDLPQPEALKGELRPYQKHGFSWMTALLDRGFGACLADDMGLGKTIQLIASLLHSKETGALNGPSLLVCPTSVLGNWQRELRRFAPALSVLLHYGPGRAAQDELEDAFQSFDIVLTSYATAQRDIDGLSRMTWGLAVFDEAQHLKNRSSKQARAALMLRAERKVALTGTPVENHLLELWALMDLLNPGYLGSADQFKARFASPIERRGDEAAQRRLQAVIRPFVLRRRKSDPDIAPDLPEKSEHKEYCPLTEEQARLYENVVSDLLRKAQTENGMKRRGLILSSITKLKQICNDPAHALREPVLRPGRSGKLMRLTDLVKELLLEGERVIVFTQYAAMAKLLAEYFTRILAEETLLLHGTVRKAQRDAMITRFQEDPDAPRIFVASLKTGGFGLNLTRAARVIHYDRWWNPAVENQATDRVHRIGQTRDVHVHKLIAAGTLEESIDELLESKRALAEQVLATGENWLTELSTEELQDLLSLRREWLVTEDETEDEDA